MTRTCWSCQFKKTIPGNAHIACAQVFDDSNPVDTLAMLLGIVGRTALPGANKPVRFVPTMKKWPGCGAWPAAFDPNIVTDCAGYQERGAPKVEISGPFPLGPLLDELARDAFGSTKADAIQMGVCLNCRRTPHFTTEAGRREYAISGYCEECFDILGIDQDGGGAPQAEV